VGETLSHMDQSEGGRLMPQFEIIFTETVRSKCVIEADSHDEAVFKFEEGDIPHPQELECFNAEIEKIYELGKEE
jgi:hypothetical protein